MQVNFMGVHEIEAAYERPSINTKVEQGSTSVFMCNLPQIASFLLCMRT